MSSLSLSSHLDELESNGRYQELSSYILNLMVKNVDLSSLASKIIKFLAVPYPPCKKVMYSFLSRYSATISDLNILATNSLLKDYEDPNPFIRRIVIRTVCSVPCLSDLAFHLLPRALGDVSPYVRSAAASCCPLVVTSTNAQDHRDLVDKLYEMIRGPDAGVVGSCLSALDGILSSDGGIAVNAKMASHLMGRTAQFGEWNFAILCDTMKRYVPKDTEELLGFLNNLDQKMLDSDPHVAYLAADIALHLASASGQNFSSDILQQFLPQLRSLLNHSSQEIRASALQIIANFLPEHRAVFQPSWELFFCCFGDSAAAKVLKLEILAHLVTRENLPDVAEEFLSHCCDVQSDVSRAAVRSFTLSLQAHPEFCRFLTPFLSLMDIQYNDLREDIFNALSALDYSEVLATIRRPVFDAVSKHADSLAKMEAKMNLLNLIRNHGRDIDNSPYILERMLGDESALEDENYFSNLLTACVRLFLCRPAEMQLLLGCTLQRATSAPCLLLRKQALIYNYLLKESAFNKTFTSGIPHVES